MLKLIKIIVLSFCCLPLLASSSKDIKFKKACHKGKSITISAVGDVLLHGFLQVQGFKRKNGFMSLWEEAIPYFREADIAYANLEGAVAKNIQCNGTKSKSNKKQTTFDCRKNKKSVYTGYPYFNYHPMLIDDLKNSGINLVSTSNNHSLDRYAVGVNATIDALRDGNLKFFGTRKSNERSKPFYTTTKNNGIKIAWIACTYATNTFIDTDHQLEYCYNKQVERTIKAVKKRVDAVIVTPHWGTEYKTYASNIQKKYAKKWLNAGALAIIGSHPHVIQPWEKVITDDGRETFIIYSLGNFVSGQDGLAKKSTIILFLGLTKNEDKTWINGVRYVPAHMRNWGSKDIYLRVDSLQRTKDLKHEVMNFLKPLLGTKRRLLPGEEVITNKECY